jgi:hypothetical protein
MLRLPRGPEFSEMRHDMEPLQHNVSGADRD